LRWGVWVRSFKVGQNNFNQGRITVMETQSPLQDLQTQITAILERLPNREKVHALETLQTRLLDSCGFVGLQRQIMRGFIEEYKAKETSLRLVPSQSKQIDLMKG
jgi:hypothetical protein